MKGRVFLKILLSFVLMTGAIQGVECKKVTTKVKAPKSRVSKTDEKRKRTAKDKDRFSEVVKKMTFTGYDKKGSSTTETFFVTNGSEVPLKSFELEISYFTPEGKQLHKRVVEIKEELPAGETRKIDLKSWDGQKNFHYVKSEAGKNGSAPYTVRFKIVSFIEV